MARNKPTVTAGPAAYLARQGEYTVSEVSRIIDRSPDTVRRWIREGRVTPRTVMCGSQKVAVFNAKEITDLKKVSKSVRMGRPPVGLKPMTNGAKS